MLDYAVNLPTPSILQKRTVLQAITVNRKEGASGVRDSFPFFFLEQRFQPFPTASWSINGLTSCCMVIGGDGWWRPVIGQNGFQSHSSSFLLRMKYMRSILYHVTLWGGSLNSCAIMDGGLWWEFLFSQFYPLCFRKACDQKIWNKVELTTTATLLFSLYFFNQKIKPTTVYKPGRQLCWFWKLAILYFSFVVLTLELLSAVLVKYKVGYCLSVYNK